MAGRELRCTPEQQAAGGGAAGLQPPPRPAPAARLAVLRDAAGHGVGPQAGGGGGRGRAGPGLDDGRVVGKAQLLQRLPALRVVQLRQQDGRAGRGASAAGSAGPLTRPAEQSHASFPPGRPGVDLLLPRPPPPCRAHKIRSPEASKAVQRQAAGLVEPVALLRDLALDVQRGAQRHVGERVGGDLCGAWWGHAARWWVRDVRAGGGCC